MGFIKALSLKRIGTEKTRAKVYKIFSIYMFIVGFVALLVLFFNLYIEVLAPEVRIRFSLDFVMLFLILVLYGAIFGFISKFIKIESEIKDLKDKIQE